MSPDCFYTEAMNTNGLPEFYLPAYEEIPDVGLYLDQTAKYINSFFSDYPQLQVTPSMIANYVKLKLVARVHKKTYNRDQIACFFIIALSKTVLSMDHIRILLGSQSVLDHAADYACFIGCMKENLSYLNGIPYSNASRDIPHHEMLNRVTVAICHKMFLEWYFEHTEFTQE